MQNPSTRIIPLAAGVAAGAAGLMALAGGTGPGAPVLVVAAAAVAAIAYWSWRDSRAVEAPGRLWLRLLVAGPAVAGLTVLGSFVPWPDAVDLGDNAYWLLSSPLPPALCCSRSASCSASPPPWNAVATPECG